MNCVQKMLMAITLTINIAGSTHAMQLTQEEKNKKLFAAAIKDCVDMQNAIEQCRIEDIRNAIKQGAQVDAKDKRSKTQLHVAALMGHAKVAQFLLDRGAQVDAKDWKDSTPLYYAAENGHVEAVRLLLDRGAQVDAIDSDGCMPLHCTAVEGRTEIGQLLTAYDDEDSWKKQNPAIKKFVQDNKEAATALMLKRYHDLRLQWNDAFHDAMQIRHNGKPLPILVTENIADMKIPKLTVVAKRLGISKKLNLEKKRLPGFYPLPQPESIEQLRITKKMKV